ncbi:Feruloyl esterase protein [Dioscorea alata]|uniref:Feruloyl esterase protein n=1 Tax=Dioscorea alata TaxID=55571 RepID=A0ACB7VQU1_DIOAL|nr:Feruloyl esterase protein [Dioscorea alata]
MEQLVNFIIRPPRADYSPKNDLLEDEFMLKGRWFHRKDLVIVNSRGHKLQCSHYTPVTIPEGKPLPCVIYCHGNSGCRADASEAAIILLPSNITVFTLDFSGSGLSDGEHVTLGWYEKDDLRAVVNHLRSDGNVSYIGLWGRSMGAVTSLMYAAEDPSVAGMVLDSPFSILVDLMMELVDTYKYPLPKFTVKLAIQHMRKVIKKKANFDIMDLDTIQVAKCCFVPVLLGHATDDDFIRPHHSDRIFESYAGDKNVIKFDGDHNSPRPQFYFDSITIFFHNVLNPPSVVFDEHDYHAMHEFFDKDSWATVHEVEYSSCNGTEPSSGRTEDAISQLRSKRPMSRTEVPPDISQGKQFGEPSHQDGTKTDDEYAEYSFDGLDGLSDVPSSIEDEERMLMEAIMQSLKEMEALHPQEEMQPKAEQSPLVQSNTPVEASTAESSRQSEATGSSISPSTDSESSADLAKSVPISYSDDPAAKKNSSGHESQSNSNSSSVDHNFLAQDVDTEAGTQARLVVEKGPSLNVLDGLAQRWRLSFFKNNR